MKKILLATLVLLAAGATSMQAMARDGRHGPYINGQVSVQGHSGYNNGYGDRDDDNRRYDRRDDRDDHDGYRDHGKRYKHGRYDAYRHGYYDGNRYYGNRYDGRRHGYYNGYRHDRGYYMPYGYRAPIRYVYPSGYYNYNWRAGHRLPRSYYAPSYYVDYDYYDLAPPPYGHRYVRVNNDVVMVALATGVIHHVLHGIFR